MDLDFRFLSGCARYAQRLVTAGFAVSTSHRTGGNLCHPSQAVMAQGRAREVPARRQLDQRSGKRSSDGHQHSPFSEIFGPLAFIPMSAFG